MSASIYVMTVWILLMFVLGVVFVLGSITLFIRAAIIIQKAKEKSKLIAKRTSMQYNKIAALSPSELEVYLSNVFSKTLELCAAEHISDRDPKGRSNLYTAALTQFIQYLTSSYEAIEYYYGAGYVINWFSLQYRLLDIHGEIDKIIHKSSRYNEHLRLTEK